MRKQYERHDMRKSPEYRAYCAMKGSCGNARHPGFRKYGGQGVSVCAQWAASFDAFLKDVGRRPSEDFSLQLFNGEMEFGPGKAGWLIGSRRPWSQAEIDAVVSMRRRGIGNREISRNIGRTLSGVEGQISKLTEAGVSIEVDLTGDLADQYSSRTYREAVDAGHTFYFTGRPCPKGHVDKRTVHGRGCATCVAERNAEFHVRERREIARRKGRWYQQNIDREQERSRQYSKNNKEKRSAAGQRRRARLAAAEGNHTAEDIARLLRLQSHRCAYCKKALGKIRWHIDHITPLSAGGTNYASNLQILCPKCNCSKNARDPIEFAQSRGLLL